MSKFTINGHSIQEELLFLAQKGNKTFTQSLHPGIEHILGIRIPDLRVLARQIAASDWQAYLGQAGTYYMEERMLQGLVLGYIRPIPEVEAYLRYLDRFVEVINSWSVCDTFTFAGGKIWVQHHQSRIWTYILSYMRSSRTYEIRFGVVMALRYFVNREYVVQLLGELELVHHEDYYVKMAVAWAISVCFVYFPEVTMRFLTDNQLDDFTYNKSLQKIVESYRVAPSVKQVIKAMRR